MLCKFGTFFSVLVYCAEKNLAALAPPRKKMAIGLEKGKCTA
jgi:hypothetical protein